MAKDNKIHMPGAFGGLMRYDEEFWLQGLNEIENLLSETEVLARKLGKI